jgi:hypothetical protein
MLTHGFELKDPAQHLSRVEIGTWCEQRHPAGAWLAFDTRRTPNPPVTDFFNRQVFATISTAFHAFAPCRALANLANSTGPSLSQAYFSS